LSALGFDRAQCPSHWHVTGRLTARALWSSRSRTRCLHLQVVPFHLAGDPGPGSPGRTISNRNKDSEKTVVCHGTSAGTARGAGGAGGHGGAWPGATRLHKGRDKATVPQGYSATGLQRRLGDVKGSRAVWALWRRALWRCSLADASSAPSKFPPNPLARTRLRPHPHRRPRPRCPRPLGPLGLPWSTRATASASRPRSTPAVHLRLGKLSLSGAIGEPNRPAERPETRVIIRVGSQARYCLRSLDALLPQILRRAVASDPQARCCLRSSGALLPQILRRAVASDPQARCCLRSSGALLPKILRRALACARRRCRLGPPERARRVVREWELKSVRK
jgi:hypothetical protein